MSLVVLPKMKTAVLSGANIVDYSTSEHIESVERYRGVLFDEATHRATSRLVNRDLDSVILQSRRAERGLRERHAAGRQDFPAVRSAALEPFVAYRHSELGRRCGLSGREWDHGPGGSVLLPPGRRARRVDDEDAPGRRGVALSAQQTLSSQTHPLGQHRCRLSDPRIGGRRAARRVCEGVPEGAAVAGGFGAGGARAVRALARLLLPCALFCLSQTRSLADPR